MSTGVIRYWVWKVSVVMRLPYQLVAFDNHDQIDFTSDIHMKTMLQKHGNLEVRHNWIESMQ